MHSTTDHATAAHLTTAHATTTHQSTGFTLVADRSPRATTAFGSLRAGARAAVRTADVAVRTAQTVALVIDPTGGQGRARRNAVDAAAADSTRARDRRVAGQAVAAGQQPTPAPLSRAR